MKLNWLILLAVLLGGVLAACGPATTSGDPPQGGGINDPGAASGSVTQTSTRARLQDDYAGALSVQGQLAAGTLLLESTGLAVDEELAAKLLPFWQAVQSLSNSDTAAPAEIEAVINQIQDLMTAEQVAAIADMRLTEDTLATLQEEGALVPGFGRGQGQTEGSGNQIFPRGGFFPGGGPGGIPGGRGFAGGGSEGGVPGGLDPQALATRQAQFAGEVAGTVQERILTGSVVRLLGTKTGEYSGDQRTRIFEVVFEAVSDATGLTTEEIQAQIAEGVSLADIVQANGGDVEAVRAALVEKLSELPNAGDLDPEVLASQWLGLDQ